MVDIPESKNEINMAIQTLIVAVLSISLVLPAR